MRGAILIFVFILTSVWLCHGQERKPDTIIMMDGDSVIALVSKISEYDVTYNYPNEPVTYTVSKNSIDEIRFGSGRTEQISKKVKIRGEADWYKVIVTQVPSDIKGLTSKGQVLAKHATGIGGAKVAEEKVMEKLRKEAAALGAHIILVESKTINNQNRIVVSGKAYTY